MASDGGHTNDATARRRRIAEKGSDRLALITGSRAPNPSTSSPAQSLHSSNASCPPSLTGLRWSDEGLGGGVRHQWSCGGVNIKRRGRGRGRKGVG
ncbi:hypothetical protein E3N88_35271 [Mikania micrantha]|uniref:Uncharacterized protein n=1 Tax=Mikania micrantha TaxID=192012 RepID=A0A5N6M0Z7_9ASTR|nr:hypothetical protein E3N88_35271 [Mikania micrantha]